MRLRPAGGLDLGTGALLVGGAGLIAASLAAAFVLLVPFGTPDLSAAEPTPASSEAAARRPSEALLPDRVAAVLYVDTAAGAGSGAQAGDHVDVLGYFSKQVSGSENVTRVLLQDIAVLAVDRSGDGAALTLAVPQDAALLLQEAQALGARPLVTLRAVNAPPEVEPAQTNFSDADLAARLATAH